MYECNVFNDPKIPWLTLQKMKNYAEIIMRLGNNSSGYHKNMKGNIFYFFSGHSSVLHPISCDMWLWIEIN